MGKTKIEWTEYTWNPVTGCTKISTGCKNCYAERMAHRLRRMGVKGYEKGFELTLQPGRLNEPLKRRKPSMYFVCSMADLFHEEVPFSYIDKVFDTMALCNGKNTFQVLTKRPERMLKWWKQTLVLGDERYLPNVWLGITTENQEMYNERIGPFGEIGPFRKFADNSAQCEWTKFISAEPLLSPISLTDECKYIDQIIVGGESGPGRRPMDISWAWDLNKQCLIRDIPFFMKQIDKVIPIPKELMIRQYPRKKINRIYDG